MLCGIILNTMKTYGTWHAFLVEQLAEEDDVRGFLAAVIEEYHIHGDLATIQLALQYVVEAYGGLTELAKKIDIEPQVLSAVLDNTKAPSMDTLRIVLSAFGCCLSIKSLDAVNTQNEVAAQKAVVA